MSIPEELVDCVADLLEPALRSDVRPWAEDPDGFYRSSAYVIAREILTAVSEAGWVRRDDGALSRDGGYVDGYTEARQALDEARAQAEFLAGALREIADKTYASQIDQPDDVVRFANRLFFIAEKGLDAFRESRGQGA